MKKFNLIIRVLSLLILVCGCSSNTKTNLSVMNNIDQQIEIQKKLAQDNLDVLKSMSIMPGMRLMMKPYIEKVDKIQKIHLDLFHKISTLMYDAIREEGGTVELNTWGYAKLNIKELNDIDNYTLESTNQLLQEIEKSTNHLLSIIWKFENLYHTEPPEHISNPTSIEDLDKLTFDEYPYQVRNLMIETCNLLLIPKDAAFKEMFSYSNLCSVISNLNILRLKIVQSFDICLRYYKYKATQPIYKFNKVEPIVFSRNIVSNDSIAVYAMVAAYDSTEIPKIRFSVDGKPEKIIATSKFKVHKNAKEIQGEIGVKERGEIKWKPWIYRLK